MNTDIKKKERWYDPVSNYEDRDIAKVTIRRIDDIFSRKYEDGIPWQRRILENAQELRDVLDFYLAHKEE